MFPTKDKKIKYVTPVRVHWHNSIILNQKLLNLNSTYTVFKVLHEGTVVRVWLEEFPDVFFSLHSFEY